MRTLFISDLHLSEDTPKLTALFLDFITHHACKAEALYILGDFFNAYLGDDIQSPWQTKLERALAQCAAAGTRLYLLPGNRDFLIGEAFCKRTSMTLLPEYSVIELNEPSCRILLTHGDLLCTRDVGYQRLRTIVQSKLFRRIAYATPASVRNLFARKLRRASQSAVKTKSPEAFLPTEAAIEQAFRKHACTVMIHGHIHTLGSHDLIVDGQDTRRYVLGDWTERCGSALSIDENGCELMHICPRGRLEPCHNLD